MPMQIPEIIQTIATVLKEHHAQAIIVGGAVRDYFLVLPIKDYDIEVYGLERLEELEAILKTYGKVNLVGKSFGILKFKHDGEEYDFAFPRTEEKVGIGHRGFEVQFNGELSFKEASRRRDFTLNAMGYDIEKQSFVDPYDGRKDMEQKLLRYIDDKTFMEDPLRVYRAIQFAGRFGYRLEAETFTLCQTMVAEGMLDELPKERVYEEFKKLLLKSPKPSLGFELMRQLGILRYFPELEALIGVPQPPNWHPEGDVWVHTLMALDQMALMRTGESKTDLKLMFAVLCHDLGKATHTQISPEKITAIGHEIAGIALTRSFLYRLSSEHDFVEAIIPLVEHHLKPSIYFHNRAKDKTIRKLSTKVTIHELVAVAKADFLGRTTEESRSGIYRAGDWLLEKANELNVEKAPPILLLQGRDLIALGFKPSKEFKKLLNNVYEAQLSGELTTKNQAIAYIRSLKNIT